MTVSIKVYALTVLERKKKWVLTKVQTRIMSDFPSFVYNNHDDFHVETSPRKWIK